MTVINNDARDQYTATGGQTIFNYTFEISDEDNIQVYQRASGSTPDDTADLLTLGVDYTVTGVGVNTGGTIVLTSGATLNDIVTLQGNAPPVRSTSFTPGGVIQANNLNTEFDDEILIYQTILGVQNFLVPKYPKSAIVNAYDLVLPVLTESTTWVMNAAGNEIITADFPADGAASKLDTFVTLTDETADAPNSFPLSGIGSGIMVNRVGTTDVVTRTFTGTANQLGVNDGAGVSGNPTIYIVDNPLIPGTAGMGIPQGTTAQRVIPASGIGMRYNTTIGLIEYYSGGSWQQLDTTVLGLFLPLAGGTMTGAIAMSTHKITGLGDPTAAQDAATMNYVDTQDALYLPLAGGAMTGNINMGSNYITSLLDPANAQDAATKNYVDITVAQFATVLPARAATTAALTATYLNGTAGVGATLTNADTQAAFALDGVSLNLDDLVLIKDQASPEENGYYKVTTVGDGSTDWVITRSINWDEPAEINPGDLFVITEGTTLGQTTWIETQIVTTIGTDPILFTQYSVALPIPMSAGGTGAVLVPDNGAIPYSTGTQMALLASTATAGQMFQSGASGAPSWSTPTWPSASGTARKMLVSDGTNNVYSTETWAVPGTTGNVLTSDGTNWTSAAPASTGTVNSGTQYQLAYYAATGTAVSGLTSAANGVLVTDGSGIPSISSTLPTDIAMTTPLVTTGIKDANGNLMFAFSATPAADNYFTFTNSTGNGLYITATGADITLDFWWQAKGSCYYRFLGTSDNAARLALYENTANGAAAILLHAPEAMATSRTVQMADTDISCWVVQRVSTETGAVSAGTTVIPLDDTIPQQTEGDQVMTLAITPKTTTNILVIEVTMVMASSTITWISGCLFQDSTANAIAAATHYNSTANGAVCLTFTHIMAAGTTSATTFKVRGGGQNAGTRTFNGTTSARLYGGVMASSMKITEYSS